MWKKKTTTMPTDETAFGTLKFTSGFSANAKKTTTIETTPTTTTLGETEGTLQFTSGVFQNPTNVIADPPCTDKEADLSELSELDFSGCTGLITDVTYTVTVYANGDLNNQPSELGEDLGIYVNGDLNSTLFNEDTADNGDFMYVSGTADADYNSGTDKLSTGWPEITVNDNTGSDVGPADGADICNDEAAMEFATETPCFEAEFESLESLAFSIDSGGDINFGVDAAQIDYEVTVEATCQSWGDKAVSNVVIYADCENDDGIVDTKIKFDNFDEIGEIYVLTEEMLECALEATGYGDCDIEGVTVKAGNNKGGYGPGEGMFFDLGNTPTSGSMDKADVKFEAADYSLCWDLA